MRNPCVSTAAPKRQQKVNRMNKSSFGGSEFSATPFHARHARPKRQQPTFISFSPRLLMQFKYRLGIGLVVVFENRDTMIG